MGLLCISLVGCSSESSDDETSIENLIRQIEEDEIYYSPKNVFGNEEWELEDIKTIIFLDSLNDMPSDVWDISENEDGSVMA